MQSKEIITAPIADAITPSGVVDSPFACGAFIFIDMKLIKLTQGQSTQVDDWNYDWLNQWKWRLQKSKNTFYAVRSYWDNRKCIMISMHREIMRTPRGVLTDHWNGNGLDNQEHNLRNCNSNQNGSNSRKLASASSPYKGVSWDRFRNKWSSTIMVNYKCIHLGRYKTEKEAALSYDEAAKKYFGIFANINFK